MQEVVGFGNLADDDVVAVEGMFVEQALIILM